MEPLVGGRPRGLDRKRLTLALAAGLGVAGVAVGTALWLRGAPPAPAPVPVRPVVSAPSEPAPAAESVGAEPEKELSFPRLMEILGAESKQPTVAARAAEFGRAFMLAPDLEEIYEEFKAKEQRGERPTAAAFLAALRHLPAFSRLAGEFGKGAAGSAAVLALSRQPELKEFLAAEDGRTPVREASRVAAAPGRAAPGRGAVSAFRGLDAGRSVQGAGALAARGPSINEAGAAPFQGARPSAGSQAGKDATAGSQGSGPAADGSTAGGGRDPGGDTGAGPGAHDVDPRLDQSFKTGAASETMDAVLRQWLADNGLDPAAYMADTGRGIWDQCFQRRELQRCDGACRHQPTQLSTRVRAVCAPPSDPTYWGTCLEVTGSETGCLKECAQQTPPCAVKDAAIETYCRAPLRPTPPQRPHANCQYVGTPMNLLPCAGRADVAVDCTQLSGQDEATRELFDRLSAQGLSGAAIAARWIDEHNKDIFFRAGIGAFGDPAVRRYRQTHRVGDWRDLPESLGGYPAGWR